MQVAGRAACICILFARQRRRNPRKGLHYFVYGYIIKMFIKVNEVKYVNIQEYDLMNVILEKPGMNQRELALCTGFSLGKVNHSLQVLMEKKYLNSERQLTEKALAEMEERKPQNAVILAAGYGMRMVPKGLLEIKGEPLIERLICQLQEVGITDIDVIVGFMKEQYEYLIDKYNVNLVFNKEYVSKNIVKT